MNTDFSKITFARYFYQLSIFSKEKKYADITSAWLYLLYKDDYSFDFFRLIQVLEFLIDNQMEAECKYLCYILNTHFENRAVKQYQKYRKHYKFRYYLYIRDFYNIIEEPAIPAFEPVQINKDEKPGVLILEGKKNLWFRLINARKAYIDCRNEFYYYEYKSKFE